MHCSEVMQMLAHAKNRRKIIIKRFVRRKRARDSEIGNNGAAKAKKRERERTKVKKTWNKYASNGVDCQFYLWKRYWNGKLCVVHVFSPSRSYRVCFELWLFASARFEAL